MVGVDGEVVDVGDGVEVVVLEVGVGIEVFLKCFFWFWCWCVDFFFGNVWNGKSGCK